MYGLVRHRALPRLSRTTRVGFSHLHPHIGIDNRDSFTLDTILLVTRTELTSPMSYVIVVLLLASVSVARVEPRSQFDQVKQRLKASAEQLSMINFLEVPDADSYLNYDLVKNAPHKMNMTTELTKIIREWSPRLLALDPTCPYYFSTLVNASQIDEDFNLLSHLQARMSTSILTRRLL